MSSSLGSAIKRLDGWHRRETDSSAASGAEFGTEHGDPVVMPAADLPMIDDLSFLDDLVDPLRPALEGGCALTIGNFDGVHLGHQAILTALRNDADRLSVPAVAMTFEPHPATVFKGQDPASYRISTEQEKVAALRMAGAHHVLIAKFQLAFRELTAEVFVDELLVARLGVRAVHIGYDFNFGKGRSGSHQTLAERLDPQGVLTTVHDAVSRDGVIISSSEVRRRLAVGDLDGVAELIGRGFSMSGSTASGAARGRTMGVPTINVYPSDRLLPPRGVYATRVALDGVTYDAVSNLGVRPTFADDDRVSLESFLFADPGDVAEGSAVETSLVRFIRPERRFESSEALTAQIRADATTARKILASS